MRELSCDIIDITDIEDIVKTNNEGKAAMPSLLIRDMNETTKHELAVQAARHGRSQQAEVLAILENALHPDTTTWFEALCHTAQKAGGIDLPIMQRHAPRVTGILV